MKNYDVIIIGAGPSGSTAARFTASSGLTTLVLEKDKLFREKACAGGVTGRVITEFGVPDRAFDRMIYGDFLCSPKCVTVALEKPHVIGACTMRGKFDKVLSDMATDAGAEFREESKVIAPIYRENAVVGVKSRENGGLHEYRAGVTVIADGSPSDLSRKLGIYVGDSRAIFLCYQHHMKLDNSKIDERIKNNIEIYFGNNVVPIGYAWIFPKDGQISVGLGTPLSLVKEQRINLRRRLENFVKHHPVAKAKLQGAKILFSQVASLPHGGLGKDELKIVSRIYGNGYVIIGDAAGFVSPATGEGIYYGMKSGELAAETVVKSCEIDDFSEKSLTDYYRKIRRSIIYGDMRDGWKIRHRFLESDKYTEKLVGASKGDPWFGELTRQLISGEIPYPQFLKTLYTHPHKLFKALLFY